MNAIHATCRALLLGGLLCAAPALAQQAPAEPAKPGKGLTEIPDPELGLMRATDQITALGLMAIDPVAKTVAPRFWAAVITVPLLTGFFCSFAIATSWFQGVQVLGIDSGMFWQAMQDAVDFRRDFVNAFVKSAVFGGTAALVASYVGYHAEPTIEGTSVATTRAVVNASLLVLMFNFVMSAFLF